MSMLRDGERRPVRRAAADRRAEVAQAILRIIGRDGFSGLSTKTLAAEIGVSSGALFRHFESIEQAIVAAVDLAAQELERTLPDVALPPVERLLAQLDARLALFEREPAIAWMLRADEARQTLPPAGLGRLQEIVAASRSALTRALEEGRAKGLFRADQHIDSQMLLVQGAVHAWLGFSGLHRQRGVRAALSRKEFLDDLLAALSLSVSVHRADECAAKPPESPKASRRRGRPAAGEPEVSKGNVP